MCGICGIYNMNAAPVDYDLLKKMTATMIHRGPDGEGYYVDGFMGLGHRRLSIIDVEGGAHSGDVLVAGIDTERTRLAFRHFE